MLLKAKSEKSPIKVLIKAIRFPLTILGISVSSHAMAAPSLALDEVIVTAQKREQNVQDTPLSIGVVGGEQIERFSIRTTDDLDNFVPGLVIQESPQNLSSITVRGVGTGAGNETYDQSVSLFIDGVFAGKQREFQTSLFDIERIEVIKGTQTTLLGKNTSLGAISLITRKPGDVFSGSFDTNYDYENKSVATSGGFDLPIGDIKTRVAFNHVNDNGFVDNVATGEQLPIREQDTVRMITMLDLTDAVDFELMYQYDDLSIIGDPFQPTIDNVGVIAQLDAQSDVSLDNKKSSFVSQGEDGEASDVQLSHRFSATGNWDLGDNAITSITGWSKYTNDRVVDSDFTAGEYLLTTYDTAFDQISQEFRLTSPLGEDVDYIAGIFFLQSDYSNVNLIDANFPDNVTIGPIKVQGATTKDYEQRTRALSMFGQSTYHFTDEFRLTTGLRYTRESKDAKYGSFVTRPGPGTAIIPSFPITNLSRDENALDGSLNLQYDLTHGIMTYVSWAKGTKSGGFTDAADTPQEAEYKAEVAKTTEIGTKMTLLDGAAIFNFALFHIDIEDFQVVLFNGLGFEVDTVPASSQGAEMDGLIALTENLSVHGGLTYAKAKQDDTLDALPRSPEYSGNIGFRYEDEFYVPGLRWSMDTLIGYRSVMYHQLGEVSPSETTTKYDLRFGITPNDYSWEVAFVARNIFNESTSSFGAAYPLFGDIYGADQLGLEAAERKHTYSLQGNIHF